MWNFSVHDSREAALVKVRGLSFEGSASERSSWEAAVRVVLDAIERTQPGSGCHVTAAQDSIGMVIQVATSPTWEAPLTTSQDL